MVIVEKNKTISVKIVDQCKDCRRQFIEEYTKMGYSPSVKENCLKMYVNGLGFRAIERVSGVNHNTIIRWVKATASKLPNAPSVKEIPEITEIDELYAERYTICEAVYHKGTMSFRTRAYACGIL